MRLDHMKSERGVAMVTVLFVAAVLTVVSSASAFVAVQEFRAARDDRTGVQALAFAEAGIDQLLVKLKDGSVGWGHIAAAGCTVNGTSYPAIEVSGNVASSVGSYVARLTVYNPTAANPVDRIPPAACPSSFPDPRAGERYFAITSVGSQPAARRTVRQVVQIRPLGLPIAIYAIESVEGNGTTVMNSISMITEGVISKRDQMGFNGTDPYYTLADFYGPSYSATTKIPAAAHARGQISYGPASSLLEHRPGFEPNCVANSSGGTAGQSLWDGSGTAALAEITSGCTGWLSRPPTSQFDAIALKRVAPRPNLTERDYQTLRDAAKSSGVYCVPAPSNKLNCTRQGTPYGIVDTTFENNNPIFNTLPNSYVFYVDYPTAGDPYEGPKTITWKRTVAPCTDNPTTSKSAVIIVRNGSMSMEGGAYIVGALFLPEGKFTNKGSFTLEGTIIARRLDIRGSATFSMTPCWVNNLPGPFLETIPAGWSEIDR